MHTDDFPYNFNQQTHRKQIRYGAFEVYTLLKRHSFPSLPLGVPRTLGRRVKSRISSPSRVC
uniref:Uncharacterized protein n=1 Tax=Anguilla anguilla TaxID=7936 RepID=A0A0E9U0W1_ANGAN